MNWSTAKDEKTGQPIVGFSSQAISRPDVPGGNIQGSVLQNTPEQPIGTDLGSKLMQRGMNIREAFTAPNASSIYGKEEYGENWTDPIVRLIRAAGQTGGATGDIVSSGLSKLIGAIPEGAKEKGSEVLKYLAQNPVVKRTGKAMQIAKKTYEENIPEAERKFLGDVAGASGLALDIAGAQLARKPIGEAVESLGKKQFAKQAKLTDKTARKLTGSSDIWQGGNELARLISKYDLESIPGGTGGIYENTIKALQKSSKASDDIVAQIAKNPNAKTRIMDDIKEVYDKLGQQTITDPELKFALLNPEKAQKYVEDVHSALVRAGYGGEIHASQLPEVKRLIDDIVEPYTQGAIDETGVMLENVGRVLYSKFKGDLEKFAAKEGLDIATPNKKTYELMLIKQGLEDTMKRQGKKNFISLRDTGLGAAGIAGGVPAVIPAIAAKKAFEGGRGPSALIEAGKAIKGAPIGRTSAGGAIGGAIGAGQGDSEEERTRNAIIGALLGAGGGALMGTKAGKSSARRLLRR